MRGGGGLPRRHLLLLAAAAACGKAPPPCESPSSGPGLTRCLIPPKSFRVPGAKRLAPGEGILSRLDDASAALIARDAAGLYARNAVCTHSCCVVSICDASCAPLARACEVAQPVVLSSGAALLCPCHGSTYSADGRVLGPPATADLEPLALRLDGEDAIVDLGQTVTADTRVDGS